jgi:F-type H+-transporting ATPase subunit epsilon
MAEEGKVEFELVSPERLLVSEPVDMVVVPGAEGDFGVLPRHAPLISTVRPGVIRIYEGNQVTSEIFVAGGFAEVTGTRCTVLAEMALPVGDIDKGKVEAEIRNLQDDEKDAKSDDERAAIQARIKVREAMLSVAA